MNRKAFLSIEVAFAMLILSFAFVMLLRVQGEIAKDLTKSSLDSFRDSNNELLKAIKQDTCKQDTIHTKQGHTYNICKYSIQQDSVVLQFFMPI